MQDTFDDNNMFNLKSTEINQVMCITHTQKMISLLHGYYKWDLMKYIAIVRESMMWLTIQNLTLDENYKSTMKSLTIQVWNSMICKVLNKLLLLLLLFKGEASPSNYADWVNGGWF